MLHRCRSVAGISAVRAYFDKARAVARLADAKTAIDAIGS
jgi:hypothetical protein